MPRKFKIILIFIAIAFSLVLFIPFVKANQLTLRPTEGEGHTLEWTPEPAGTHYTTVDEATTNDSDYVYIDAKNNFDASL